MEAVGSSETNFSAGKSERKKMSLPTPRPKFRQHRRSHAAVDSDDYKVTNNHSASAPSVSVPPIIYM